MAKNTLDETKEIKVLINQVKAFCDTINAILHNTGTAETGRYASYKDMARMYNGLAAQAKSVLKVRSMTTTLNIDSIPGYGDTLWVDQKRILEQVLISAKMLLVSLEGSVDFVDDEFENIGNFFSSRLRTAIFSKPGKEVEVQNAIESLLVGRGLSKGIDYDRESGKIEFSGKEFIPDFVIQKLNLCIEVKLLREGRKSEIIEEISADITAYKKTYSHQLYIVYDLGVIQNEAEFKRDIEKSDGVKVIIIKH